MELPPFNYPNPLGLFGGAKQVLLDAFSSIFQALFIDKSMKKTLIAKSMKKIFTW